MAYEPAVPSFSARPRSQLAWTPKWTALFQIVGTNFSLSTLILVGACLQSILVLVIRNKYALLPAFFILFLRSIDTFLITFKFKSNPYVKDVIKGRVTALVPNEDGQITGASAQKVAVLLLGAKSNHPLGFFAPEFGEVGVHLNRMNKYFDSPESPAGFLGQTSYTRNDERGAIETTFVSYWRSIEDLHAFAHTGLHRDTWLWWEKNLKRMDAVGINHEIFLAEPGAWENVYVNFQPTMLGATTYLKKGDKLVGGNVADEWIHPLVDARRGKLAKSSGRLGWNPTQHDAIRPAAEEYGTAEK